jgi:opacity protein-like surface antigen
MSLRKLFITGGLALVVSTVAPARASADWLFTPFIGGNFSGSASIAGGGEDFADDFGRQLNYGASLAWMGRGVVGFEVDFGYSPNFFNSNPDSFSLVGDGNVTTLMGNLVIGAPMGNVRPYASGGVGLIKSKVDNVGQFFGQIDNSDFGFNLGGGVMGFFNDNIGLRGDIRYFRSVNDTNPDKIDLNLGDFHFWRGSVGVTFKF